MSEPGDITDVLNDQDQILMAAWMLPNTGDLSGAQRKQALENFTQYIKQHDIKITDVGRQLGSPRTSTIMDLLSGTYRANADEHIRKLNMWVEQHARARVASLTDTFVTTRVAKAMLLCARLVRENGTMGLAMGPTGIGKSRCAQAIHEHYVGSIYVRVVHGAHHPKGL